MYKYKQTTDVEVGDLIVWTDISESHTTLTKNKVYRVTECIDSDRICVVNDKNDNTLRYYKTLGFKVLQTKPASKAVVGDYMYRISSGTNTFTKHSIVKITEITPGYFYYKAGYNVLHDEVIVIAQAEPEVTYPLFMHWHNNTGTLVKFNGLQSGTQLTDSEFNNAGDYSLGWTEHTDQRWKPCDFTIQPDIDDLDWWQARFEAGLPVYANTVECKNLSPREWNDNSTFSMTYTSTNLCAEIALGATTECSLQPTTKEQPMKLQQLLDAIFGVSDYEAKPKFIVTVFNNDKEVATTTADSVEEIQQTIQSDTRLWGCKLVAYKIHSELQTQVPVTITKFKKESNASAE